MAEDSLQICHQEVHLSLPQKRLVERLLMSYMTLGKVNESRKCTSKPDFLK